MYIAELLNAYNLFQRTAGWKKKLGQGNEKDISAFLYRATSAVVHLQRIHELNNQCVQEYELFEEQLQVKDDRFVFHSMNLVALINEISPLLSTLKIMQDSILPLIGKTLGIPAPSSMNGGIKKLHRYNIPQNIRDMLLRYWQSNGLRFRGYRDIDQHFHNLIDHVFFQVNPDKKVLILFPDNPEEKSSDKFTYVKNINAIELLESSFNKLHELTENIAAILGFQPNNHSTEVRMDQLGELTPPQERTLSLMVEKKTRRKDKNNVTLEITGLKMNQKKDMRVSFQKLLISEDKLKELNRRVQPPIEQNKTTNL